MCLANLIRPRRNVQQVTVDWRDSIWMPPIAVQPTVPESAAKSLPHPPHLCHHGRHIFSKPMRKTMSSARRFRAGFTLVELLTVIAIIAILAAMLLPVLAAAKVRAQKTQAGLQERDIVTAVTAYNSDYGRFPVSPGAQAAANNSANSDYTYGAIFQSPAGAWPSTIPANYSTNNSDVIAILMDYTNYPFNGSPTVNTNYQKNPRQIAYLNAKLVSDTVSPGVGTDLIYRDPWGSPYVISMDLNYDEQCKDAFYSQASVSGPGGANSNPGINGLTEPSGTTDNFQFHGKVMVWSAGPLVNGKAMVDPANRANQGINKNHVVSWAQ